MVEQESRARQEAEQHLDELVTHLERPLRDVERAFGWDDDLQLGLLEWSTELRGKLRRGETLTRSDLASGIVRWLDAAGVGQGELADLAARASNAVDRVIEGPPPKVPLLERWKRRREEQQQMAELNRLVEQLDAQRSYDPQPDNRDTDR